MKRLLLFCALCGCGAPDFARGQNTMDPIGVTALRAQDATLTGSGTIAMQVEAGSGFDPKGLDFEVDPGSPGQAVALFSWRSAVGSAVRFPNNVGTESPHADQVAEAFYGAYTGVAPGLRHVGNYEMNYFYAAVIRTLEAVTAQVFNQSFSFGLHNTAQDKAYDDYIAEHHTVVVSGIGDGGAVQTPADCYNGLGAAAYGGASSTGPTADGRCKPDITAPATVTSLSTPLVSGAAAILIQGGRRQGVNAAAAIDSRTIKALLLNGAVKPPGWSHSTAVPLDPSYGAGVLEVFNSYSELSGGRHGPVGIGYAPAANGHPPLTGGLAVNVAKGWDYRPIKNTVTEEAVNHYRITTGGNGALVSTLVWNKGYGQSRINRLALFLYNAGGELLASSTSTVDNVQQVYVSGLGAGTYELEVVKSAGVAGTAGVVSGREIYALAWDFER